MPEDRKIARLVFDSLDPAKMIPHGDRLFVQKVDVDNLVYFPDGAGGHYEFEIASGEADQEEKRGYYFGRVIAIGDGHRLETPDLAVVVTEYARWMRDGMLEDKPCGQHVERVPATVPMPFRVGEILQLERYAGREIIIRGKRYRQVNQIDVIAHCPELERALDDVGDDAAAQRIAQVGDLQTAAQQAFERRAEAVDA